MTFPEFLAKWTNPAGQRIDFDHVYGYQCVDLPRLYIYECEGLSAGVRGNAIDYWNNTSPVLLTKFSRLATQEPQAGDIVILTSPITSLGHIGIATGIISGDTFQMMEQNGSLGTGTGMNGDAIRTRFIARSRILGVLRPIPAAPLHTTPSVPMITLAQLTQLYEQTLERAPDVAGIQHYVGHYTVDYVRSDLLNSAEYKQLQANKAAAAAQAAQAAADAAKAAQIAATPPVAPAPPAVVPTSTTLYPIITTLKTYSGMTNAQNRTNPIGELLAGAKWYKFCEKGGMFNITQTPGQSSGTWINPADNVQPVVMAPVADIIPDPVVEPPKVETTADILHSFIPLMPNGSPVQCSTLQPVLAVDALGSGKPIPVRTNRTVKVYGTHEAGGHYFATVHSNDKSKQDSEMYGITISSRDNFKPFLSDPYRIGERLQVNWELIYDKVGQTIDGVYRAYRTIKKKK